MSAHFQPDTESSSVMISIPDQIGGRSLVLFDGVCGLCQRFIQFVLRHDPGATFCFCAIQDPLAEPILARHGLDANTLKTFCLVTGAGTLQEHLSVRSDAAIEMFLRLGGAWKLLGGFLRIFPRPIRDFGYNVVARIRYRVFGRLSACPVPTAAERDRFLFSEENVRSGRP